MGRFKRQQSADETIKYTLANVNLREEKSLESPILALIPGGSKVQVLDAEEDWYKVNYNNMVGYVYNEYLSTTMYPWTTVSLRLYPTSESMEIVSIPPKSRVQVIETVGDWSKVIYNDQTGYIFSYFLSSDGNPPDEYDFSDFGTDMDKFVNDNDIKSQTNNLLVTDLERFYTYVYEKGEDNNWKRLYRYESTVGKPSTPTIVGTFYISGRKPYFGSDTYRVKYATRIKGSYYYHTILFNAEGTEIIDDRLGQALSHGCIRLAVENAQWIYDNYQVINGKSNGAQLAKQFGITSITVRAIITGRSGDGRPQWENVIRNRDIPDLNRKGTARKVAQIDLKTGEIIEVFNSVKEAKTKVPKGDIPQCALGRSKSAGGYGWKYLDE